jgi:hypothetical protein
MEHSEVNMAEIVNANSLKELTAAIRQLATTLTPTVTGAPPAVPLQNRKLPLFWPSRQEAWFAQRSIADELSDTLQYADAGNITCSCYAAIMDRCVSNVDLSVLNIEVPTNLQLVYINENKVWFGPVLNRPAARNTPRTVSNSYQHFPARNDKKFWPLSKIFLPFYKKISFLLLFYQTKTKL